VIFKIEIKRMKKVDAVAYFGNESKLARALGITKGAVNQWGEIIPELRAVKLDTITKRKLKYEPYTLKQAS